MDAKLFVFKNDGTSKEVRLKQGDYLIGRGKDATLRMPLPSISREHCLITVADDSIRVKDLGSSNGTYCNSERITEATLLPGDFLGVGELTIVVQIDGNPARISRPGGKGLGESSMMETPPTPHAAPKTTSAPAPKTPAAPRMPEPIIEDEDAETTGGMGSLAKGIGNDESSVFDFDFDFEDDDRPKL